MHPVGWGEELQPAALTLCLRLRQNLLDVGLGASLLPVLALAAAAPPFVPQYRATIALTLETSWAYEKDEGANGLCRSYTRGDGGWKVSLRGSVVTARPRSATLNLVGEAVRYGGYTRMRCTGPTAGVGENGDCFGSRTPIGRASVRVASPTRVQLGLRDLRYEIERTRLWCMPVDIEIPSRSELIDRSKARLALRALRQGRRVVLGGRPIRDLRVRTSDGGEWSFVESVKWRLQLVRVR